MKDNYTTLCVFSMKKTLYVRRVLVACSLMTCTCCCAVSSTGGDASSQQPTLEEEIASADTLGKLTGLLTKHATQGVDLRTIIVRIEKCDNVASLDNIIENLNGSLGRAAQAVLMAIRKFVETRDANAMKTELQNLNTVITCANGLSRTPAPNTPAPKVFLTHAASGFCGEGRELSTFVNRTWNPSTIKNLADAASKEEIAKYVVRVSRLNVNPKGVPFNTEIGTGTLIDLGIPGLEGKVVLTASHCLQGRATTEAFVKWVHHEDGQSYFKQNWNGYNADFGSSQYLSVRQSLPTDDFPDLVTQVTQVTQDGSPEYNPIVAFCCQGEVGVAILKNPIRFPGGLDPNGLRLPNAVACEACLGSGEIGQEVPETCPSCNGTLCEVCSYSGKISCTEKETCPWCNGNGIASSTHGYIISALDNGWDGGAARPALTPAGTTDFVVGYGWSGINGGTPHPWIFRDTGPAMLSSGLKDQAVQLAKLFGWNRKKLADLTVSKRINGELYFCVDNEPLSNNAWTGSGFSGALVVNRVNNGNERKLLGMLSGNSAPEIVFRLKMIIRNLSKKDVLESIL
jgi:hypothetical protein